MDGCRHIRRLFTAGIDTKTLAYDHNWDHSEYPPEVISYPEADRFVAGSAFHCDEGDVAAQSVVHKETGN